LVPEVGTNLRVGAWLDVLVGKGSFSFVFIVEKTVEGGMVAISRPAGALQKDL
jgi:hypothetical protein